mgnify:CR=1 FL=1
MRRTRVVRRFNYAKAAFYVYLLAMIAFVGTNAVVKGKGGGGGGG